MGLDIKVYANVVLAHNEEEYSFRAFVIHESWNDRISNLEIGRYYKSKNNNYVRAISCSYLDWKKFRETLALATMNHKIDWEKDESVDKNFPFYRIIEFADNEGCLDWECCNSLYDEFTKWSIPYNRFIENEIKILTENGLSNYSIEDLIRLSDIYKRMAMATKMASDTKGVIVYS